MDYKEQLDTIYWKRKRKEILLRDNNTCQKCGTTKTLHVHHKYYTPEKMAWEYPDDCYITLCKDCHADQHPNHKVLKSKVNNKYIKNINKSGAHVIEIKYPNGTIKKDVIEAVAIYKIIIKKGMIHNGLYYNVDFEINDEYINCTDLELQDKVTKLIMDNINLKTK